MRKLIYILFLFVGVAHSQSLIDMQLLAYQQANAVTALYDGQNAADPVNEVNGVSGITQNNMTLSSVASPVQDGIYAVQGEVDATATARMFITTNGITSGDSVTFTFYVYRPSAYTVSGNIFSGVVASEGWDSNGLVVIDNSMVDYWVEVTFTRTATVDNPVFRMYNTDATTGNRWYIDNVSYIVN